MVLTCLDTLQMLFAGNVTDVASAKVLTEITARSLKPQL